MLPDGDRAAWAVFPGMGSGPACCQSPGTDGSLGEVLDGIVASTSEVLAESGGKVPGQPG